MRTHSPTPGTSPGDLLKRALDSGSGQAIAQTAARAAVGTCRQLGHAALRQLGRAAADHGARALPARAGKALEQLAMLNRASRHGTALGKIDGRESRTGEAALRVGFQLLRALRSDLLRQPGQGRAPGRAHATTVSEGVLQGIEKVTRTLHRVARDAFPGFRAAPVAGKRAALARPVQAWQPTRFPQGRPAPGTAPFVPTGPALGGSRASTVPSWAAGSAASTASSLATGSAAGTAPSSVAASSARRSTFAPKPTSEMESLLAKWQSHPSAPALFESHDMNLTAGTVPAFTDGDVIGAPKVLGETESHTVYEVELRKPDGTACDRVFKPLAQEENGYVAGETGIERDNPQTALRNISTHTWDKELGLGVTVDAQIGLLKPSPDEPVKLGLVMSRAPGVPAAALPPAEMNRWEVAREVTTLQWFDYLTGAMGDRHGNNYFIDVRQAPGRDAAVKVTGIDNDQSFGQLLRDPEAARFTPATPWFRGTFMPPVIDADCANRIMAQTPAAVREMLADKLTHEEIDAAVERLVRTQARIMELAADGKVIERHQWQDPANLELLTPENSYWARDLSLARNSAW